MTFARLSRSFAVVLLGSTLISPIALADGSSINDPPPAAPLDQQVSQATSQLGNDAASLPSNAASGLRQGIDAAGSAISGIGNSSAVQAVKADAGNARDWFVGDVLEQDPHPDQTAASLRQMCGPSMCNGPVDLPDATGAVYDESLRQVPDPPQGYVIDKNGNLVETAYNKQLFANYDQALQDVKDANPNNPQAWWTSNTIGARVGNFDAGYMTAATSAIVLQPPCDWLPTATNCTDMSSAIQQIKKVAQDYEYGQGQVAAQTLAVSADHAQAAATMQQFLKANGISLYDNIHIGKLSSSAICGFLASDSGCETANLNPNWMADFLDSVDAFSRYKGNVNDPNSVDHQLYADCQAAHHGASFDCAMQVAIDEQAIDRQVHDVTQMQTGRIWQCGPDIKCAGEQYGSDLPILADEVAVEGINDDAGRTGLPPELQHLVDIGAVTVDSSLSRPCINPATGERGACGSAGFVWAPGKWYLNFDWSTGAYTLTFSVIDPQALCNVLTQDGPSTSCLTGQPAQPETVTPRTMPTPPDNFGVQPGSVPTAPPAQMIPPPSSENGAPKIDFEWGSPGAEGQLPAIVNGFTVDTSPYKGIIYNPISFKGTGQIAGINPCAPGCAPGPGEVSYVPKSMLWTYTCHVGADCAQDGSSTPANPVSQHAWSFSSFLEPWDIGLSPSGALDPQTGQIYDERGYLVTLDEQFEHWTTFSTCDGGDATHACTVHWHWKDDGAVVSSSFHATMVRQVGSFGVSTH